MRLSASSAVDFPASFEARIAREEVKVEGVQPETSTSQRFPLSRQPSIVKPDKPSLDPTVLSYPALNPPVKAP